MSTVRLFHSASSSTWWCVSCTCCWRCSGWSCLRATGEICSGSSSGSEESFSWACWRKLFTTPSPRASDTTACQVCEDASGDFPGLMGVTVWLQVVLLQSRGRWCSLRCSLPWRGLWPGCWWSSPVWATASSSKSSPAHGSPWFSWQQNNLKHF